MRHHTTIPGEWQDAETVDAVAATGWLLEHYPEAVTEQPQRYNRRGRYRTIWLDRDTLSGDYVGSLVHRANLLYLLEECPSIIGEWHLDYGATVGGWELERDPETGEWIADPWAGDEFRALVDALDSLQGYPLLDEFVHSELVQEALDEAWEGAWKDLSNEAPFDHAAARAGVEGPPPGHVWDTEALVEHARWQDREILECFESIEGVHAYVDVDGLATAILEWAIEDEWETYRLADWGRQSPAPSGSE